MIFNINSTRGQTRFLTCVARVTCLVRNKRSTKLGAVHVLLKPAHNSAQLRCFENGNDDFDLEAFWIGDAARVGYFVPLNGPLNGHSPSNILRIEENLDGRTSFFSAKSKMAVKNIISSIIQ